MLEFNTLEDAHKAIDILREIYEDVDVIICYIGDFEENEVVEDEYDERIEKYGLVNGWEEEDIDDILYDVTKGEMFDYILKIKGLK